MVLLSLRDFEKYSCTIGEEEANCSTERAALVSKKRSNM